MSKQTQQVTLRCPVSMTIGTETEHCREKFQCTVTFMHDRGVHTLPNGDPGYPPTWELEFGDDFPEKCPACGNTWTDADLERLEAQAWDEWEEHGPEERDYDPDDEDRFANYGWDDGRDT